MKFSIIIAIAIIAMIGMVSPSVLGATYVNDPPNDFSIYYPDEWIVVEPFNTDTNEVYFDNKEDWTTSLGIALLEKDWNNKSDKQIMDSLIEAEKEHCASLNFNNSGSLCTNFQYQKELTQINLINGYRAVTVVYSAIMEYDDPNYTEKYPMIFTTTNITIENKVWQIFTISDNYEFDKYSKTLAQMIESFKVDNIETKYSSSYNPKINSDLPTSFEEATEVMIAFKNSVKEYEQEKSTTETKTNVDKIYTYDEIYAAADQAGLDCDNKHGPPFYSMDQQYAYNNCHNSINTWELNQLDRTDYYGEPQRETSGGGCLIATATYGSEMANEVQQLRELRDNTLLNTESGTQFMGTFNDIYYSFSPIIADYERENPYFKEAVKLAITPMISSLSLMENAESESEVLSMGISVIMLNLGMYLGVPAIVIVGIRKTVNS
jgi:hypothetical protein